MDRLTAIRIKYKDETFSDDIPVGVLAQNIQYHENTLIDVIGDNIDVNQKGSLQDQINKLNSEKIDFTKLENYVRGQISLIIIDDSLSISGGAADAKVTGDQINGLKDILNFNKQVPPGRVLRTTNDGKGTRWSDLNIEAPAVVTIESSRGYIFRGETVNTILTARVMRGSEDITSMCKRFVWEKYNNIGRLDKLWTKETTVPTIYVTQDDIQNKATFRCKAIYQSQEEV